MKVGEGGSDERNHSRKVNDGGNDGVMEGARVGK